MCEQEEKICNVQEKQEKQEFNKASEPKQNARIPCYKSQLRGVCLILFGVLLSCYDWVEVGFYDFADFAPVISLACGVLGVIVAFSGSLKDFLNYLNEH